MIAAPNLQTWYEALGDKSPYEALRRAKGSHWVIDSIVPRGHTWLIGAPESYKSFTALSMAHAIACGRPWMGRATRKSTVIYVAGEGGTGLHVRRAALDERHGETGPLFIAPVRPRMDTQEGLAEVLGLIEGLIDGAHISKATDGYAYLDDSDPYEPQQVDNAVNRAYTRGINASGHSPWNQIKNVWQHSMESERLRLRSLNSEQLQAMSEAELEYRIDVLDGTCEIAGFTHAERQRLTIILDTYAQLTLDDEKGTVSAFNKNTRALIEALDCDVIVLDHLQRSGGEFMGSLAKRGDGDAMLKLSRKSDLHSVLTCQRLKDAPEFEPIHVQLMPVELQVVTDHAGRPYSTLIVNPEGASTPEQETALKAIKPTASGLLLGLVREHGETIGRSDLRAKFYELPSQKQKAQAAKAAAFRRAIEDLADECLIVVSEDDGITAVDQRDITPTDPK